MLYKKNLLLKKSPQGLQKSRLTVHSWVGPMKEPSGEVLRMYVCMYACTYVDRPCISYGNAWVPLIGELKTAETLKENIIGTWEEATT